MYIPLHLDKSTLPSAVKGFLILGNPHKAHLCTNPRPVDCSTLDEMGICQNLGLGFRLWGLGLRVFQNGVLRDPKDTGFWVSQNGLLRDPKDTV